MNKDIAPLLFSGSLPRGGLPVISQHGSQSSIGSQGNVNVDPTLHNENHDSFQRDNLKRSNDPKNDPQPKVPRAVPPTVEKPEHEIVCIRTIDGEVYRKTEKFSLPSTPPLDGDIRIDGSAIKVPGKTYRHFEHLGNLTFACSFLGPSCTTCKHNGSNHNIYGNRVYLLGDSFLPPRVGGEADCVPVIRALEADFEILKLILTAQKKSGFKPKPGAVFAVGILNYLCKVGSSMYWEQYDRFSKWILQSFGGICMPFLVPVPRDIGRENLSSVLQWWTVATTRYAGNFMGSYNRQYALWIPLEESFKALGSQYIDLTAPNVCIWNTPDIIARCASKFWEGVDLDFQRHLPHAVESVFIPRLLTEIKKSAPPASEIQIPSTGVLNRNFVMPPFAAAQGTPATAAIPAPVSQPLASGSAGGTSGACSAQLPMAASGGARTITAPPPTRPTIYLFGNSLIDCVESSLRKVCSTYNICVKKLDCPSNLFSSKRIVVPGLQSDKDILVLSFLGNLMLKKQKFFSNFGKMHLVRPEYLDSFEVSELIDDICRLIGAMTQQFSGRIFLLTPFPRHISKCCHTASHKMPASTRFPEIEKYIKIFSLYVARHPKLRIFNKLEVICHWEVFGANFQESWLKDGVHLSKSGNNVFTTFLAHLMSRKPRPMTAISDPHMSFDRWTTLACSAKEELWPTLQDPECEEETAQAQAQSAASATTPPLALPPPAACSTPSRSPLPPALPTPTPTSRPSVLIVRRTLTPAPVATTPESSPDTPTRPLSEHSMMMEDTMRALTDEEEGIESPPPNLVISNNDSAYNSSGSGNPPPP